MTNEEKNLLLKDLCARIPYGLKGKVKTTDGNGQEITDDGVINSVFIDEYGAAYICVDGAEYEFEDVKPYLRQMSSMTDKEEIEFSNTFDDLVIPTHESYDYLNKKHIDYRELIPLKLALPAPEGMYYN